MPILLIPAPFVHEGRIVPYAACGLLSLQAAAQADCGEVSVLDLSAIGGRTFETSDELASAIADLVDGEPGVAGLSTMCSSFHHSLGVAVRLRERYPRVQIWMGGPHASSGPKSLLEHFPEVDAVFVGEAEASFPAALRRDGPLAHRSPVSVLGVCTRRSGSVATPTAVEPIADLDALPFIGDARDFLAAVRSSNDPTSNGVAFEIERGCSGRCSFCSTRLHWGKQVRYKSPRRVVDEMRKLHGLTGSTSFSLIGDNLAASRQMMLAICESIRREGEDWTWDGSLRLDHLQSADLDLLWDCGCRRLFIGVESGSQETLERIHKGTDLQRLVGLLYEAINKGFSVHTSFIVGFPWETSADLEATYALHVQLLERGVAQSDFSTACPLPGTELEVSFRELIEPGVGSSLAARDGLRYGPWAEQIIARCPELFRQFGRFKTANVEPIEVSATILSARMVSGHYQRSKAAPAGDDQPREQT
jgi:radical SAM superfamily enzyme YgiQ (UPF0313 family)